MDDYVSEEELDEILQSQENENLPDKQTSNISGSPLKRGVRKLGRLGRRKLWGIGILLMSLSGIGFLVAWLIWWKLPSEHLKTISIPTSHITCIEVDSSNGNLFLGTRDGKVFRCPTNEEGTLISLDHDGDKPVTSLRLSRDGFLMATAIGSRVQGWQVAEVTPETRPYIHSGVDEDSTCLEFQNAGFDIGIGLKGGGIYLIGYQHGILKPLEGKPSVRKILYYLANPSFLAFYSDGTIIRYAEYPVGTTWKYKEDQRLNEHQSAISAVTISPDATEVAIADCNGTLVFLDWLSFKVTDRNTHSDAISAILWEKDRIITSHWNGDIKIFRGNRTDGEPVHTFNARLPVLDMKSLPERNTIAIISGNNEVTLWKLPDTSASST